MSRPLALPDRRHHDPTPEIFARAEDLLEDLVGSLRFVAGEETDAGELHFALARAITNAIRIEILASGRTVDEADVERRLGRALRSGFTLAV